MSVLPPPGATIEAQAAAFADDPRFAYMSSMSLYMLSFLPGHTTTRALIRGGMRRTMGLRWNMIVSRGLGYPWYKIRPHLSLR